MSPPAGFLSKIFSRQQRGFSLVEVVIALGIVSFSLIAIIGLLPAGLKGEKQSRDDTHMTHIAATIFSALQSRNAFDTITGAGAGSLTPVTPFLPASANAAAGAPSGPGTGTSYYSADEVLVSSSDTTVAYVVTATTVAANAVASPVVGTGVAVGPAVMSVTLKIQPKGAPKEAQTFTELIDSF